MRVAVYSLTRDRLEYTKTCFESLRKNAGIPFHHLVIDNGSTDGTKDWLKEYSENNLGVSTISYKTNIGISKASNMALDILSSGNYNLICKVDNDCFVKSENILGQIVEIYNAVLPYHPKFILSPRVEGLVNQPKRIKDGMLGGRRIGQTAIVGGLFHCVPGDVYNSYRYPENLPLAHGQDDHFCDWFRRRGGEIGYIEGLVVEHFEGTNAQAVRFPEYFKRKWEEEKMVPSS